MRRSRPYRLASFLGGFEHRRRAPHGDVRVGSRTWVTVAAPDRLRLNLPLAARSARASPRRRSVRVLDATLTGMDRELAQAIADGYERWGATGDASVMDLFSPDFYDNVSGQR